MIFFGERLTSCFIFFIINKIVEVIIVYSGIANKFYKIELRLLWSLYRLIFKIILKLKCLLSKKFFFVYFYVKL